MKFEYQIEWMGFIRHAEDGKTLDALLAAMRADGLNLNKVKISIVSMAEAPVETLAASRY